MKFCRSVILVFMALFAIASCKDHKTQETLEISIVPQPNEVVQQKGCFRVNSKTAFVVPDNENLIAAAELVNLRFKNAAGFELEVDQKKPDKNFIAIELDTDAGLGGEAYILVVTPQGTTVKATSERGAFYGLMTLLQLLPPELESKTIVDGVEWNMPCVEIKDEPRFVWRGMLLDVGRHFLPVEYIKKQLDLMAMFKMNTFHWHLTEDQGWRIEIKKYPELTDKGSSRIDGDGSEYGGCYTQDQVKEIVAYAKARFINVVPEIELPGHSMAVLAAYPLLSCTEESIKVPNIWGVKSDVYCAGKEETFAFLEDVINEVVSLFPYEYVHIGGDECPKVRWEKCSLCQRRIRNEGLKDEHELQSYFIKRIEKVLLHHGKKMIGWDEILEGGLAPSATVMSWRGESGGIEAAEQGHDVIMTPGNWVYLDHYQGSSKVEPVAVGHYTTLEETYEYDPVPTDLDAKKAKHILGTQGNVWSEYLYSPELFDYHIYPRIIALAEVGWTDESNKDYNSFLERMDKQFVRLDKHDINYHIPLPEGPVDVMAFSDTAILAFTTTRPIKMVYTLDSSEPDADSDVYSSTLTFTENATVKIRSVMDSGRMSKVRTIKVEKQNPLVAADVTTSGKGMKMRLAKGNFIKVADLQKAKDWKESVFKKADFNKTFDLNEPSAAIFTGYLDIPEEGIYEFATDVDQFFIGDHLLINNDGEVKRHSRSNATIALEKGMHPVEIIFLNNVIGGWPHVWSGLEVSFKKSGDEKYTKVEDDMFCY